MEKVIARSTSAGIYMLEKTRSAQSLSADDADRSGSASLEESDSMPGSPSSKSRPSKPNSPTTKDALKKNAVIIQYAYAGVGEDEFDEGLSARQSGATTIYGYDSEDIA